MFLWKHGKKEAPDIAGLRMKRNKDPLVCHAIIHRVHEGSTVGSEFWPERYHKRSHGSV